jgi:hypothetical protein
MTAEGPAAISCAGIGFLCDENLSLPLPLSWMTALLAGGGSIRPRHAEDVLADICEYQVGRDRGGLVEAGFAPFALDVVFLRESKTAIGGERRLGGVPGRLGGQQFGHVRVSAAFLAIVEQRCGAAADHVGRFELGIGARQRKLDALVLADRTVEDDPLLGVFDALLQQPAAVADAFLRHQNALGIHPVEDVAEAPALLADQVLGRHFEIVGEDPSRAGLPLRLRLILGMRAGFFAAPPICSLLTIGTTGHRMGLMPLYRMARIRFRCRRVAMS